MSDGGEAIGFGWDSHSSQSQASRSSAAHDARQFSSLPPSHLSRALHIPRHDGGSSHLAVYDVSARYTAETSGLPIGSSKYVVALGVMQKPQAGGVPSASSDLHVYDVDFKGLGDGDAQVIGSVRNLLSTSGSLSQQKEVEVGIAEAADDKAAILTVRTGPDNIPEKFPVSTSYPIAPSQTRIGTFKHPFFKFQVPGEDGKEKTTLEWQIHPVHDGRMRYTLIRVPSKQQWTAPGDYSDILAIYHHIGVGGSLSLPYSEGILLLPAEMNSTTETMAVGSALGMLWRLRELRGEGQGDTVPKAKASTKQGLSSLKNMLSRKGKSS